MKKLLASIVLICLSLTNAFTMETSEKIKTSLEEEIDLETETSLEEKIEDLFYGTNKHNTHQEFAKNHQEEIIAFIKDNKLDLDRHPTYLIYEHSECRTIKSTVLHKIAKLNNPVILEAVIEKWTDSGKSIDIKEPYSELTPLCCAFFYSNPKCVKILLDAGANPQLLFTDKINSLCEAIKRDPSHSILLNLKLVIEKEPKLKNLKDKLINTCEQIKINEKKEFNDITNNIITYLETL